MWPVPTEAKLQELSSSRGWFRATHHRRQRSRPPILGNRRTRRQQRSTCYEVWTSYQFVVATIAVPLQCLWSLHSPTQHYARPMASESYQGPNRWSTIGLTKAGGYKSDPARISQVSRTKQNSKLTGGNDITNRIAMGMSHPAGKLCAAMSLHTIDAHEWISTYSFIQFAAGLSQSTIWS